MKHSFELRAYKVLIFPFCYLRAKRLGPIVNSEQLLGWNELKKNAKDGNGTILEIFEKRGTSYDLTSLSPAGKWVFSHKASDQLIQDLPAGLNNSVN